MKIRTIICIVVFLTLGLFDQAKADWHGGGYWGGGWHGGGYWHGGYYPSIVVGGPVYYPAYYPYGYYDDTYYYAPPAASNHPAYSGQATATQGSLTVQVQAALARQGYYHGDIDGIIGPESRAAIAAYKRDHGMEPIGIIDGDLLRSLRL